MAINAFRLKIRGSFLSISSWSHFPSVIAGARSLTTSDKVGEEDYMSCPALSSKSLGLETQEMPLLIVKKSGETGAHQSQSKKAFVTINNSWVKAISYLLKNMSKPPLLQCIQLTNISYAISSLHRIVEVGWDLWKIWVCIFLRSTPLLQVELNSNAGLLQASSENLHLLALRGQ